MKKLFAFSLALVVASVSGQAQINISGDANTEASAKLEIIRIIQERIQKMTIAEINSRIVVSKGVSTYYKVDEIIKMHQSIANGRQSYALMAQNLNKGALGIQNTYVNTYIDAVKKADALKKQLNTVTTSGNIIQLPPLPVFNISFASSSGSNPANDLTQQITDLMASYGVLAPEDWDKIDPAKKQELEAKLAVMKDDLQKQTISKGNSNATKLVTFVANLLAPGLGSVLGGVTSGKPISALVGYVSDNFQMPTEYYSSETLKLTDSERIKVIDELHLRMSEVYQQTSALSASLSSEARKRYGEVTEQRNDLILHAPKN
ncbi:hypothetical protein [Larkinella sp. C7]|uniref:hypothetical protein n=1 Tax=Larkinella sp. C7 TaxID=2576607 RepID=UPI00111148CC|nr:hypothetical protein [Larkinella sp. C7]